jgi:methionyl-tRNA formyltransferase
MIDRSLRIVFMGTPDFAVPSLRILVEAGYPVVAVVTAPDKTGGRGMKQMIVSPVKTFAGENNIEVLQPSNLKSKSFISRLKKLNADLQVVVAFRMLPEVVWNMPRLGTMNLHGSLLPAYRGAAPIQWAMINGETLTGLTTFMLRHEIDTGSILKQLNIPIVAEDDAGTLHDRMAVKGAGLVLGSIDLIASGKAIFTPQDENQISHALTQETSYINWDRPLHEIINLIRGMSPFPGAWTRLDGTLWKIFKAAVFSDKKPNKAGHLSYREGKLIAQTQNGEIEILEVQLAGKKRMNTAEFMKGYKVKDWLLT